MFMPRSAALVLAAALMPLPIAAVQTRDAGDPPPEERLGLDSVFGAHMVVQRDRPIRIWGRARPGEPVHVSLANAQARTVAGSDGAWSVLLPARRAGGPYRLEASAPSFHDRYRDILIGDVWLCAGQSNMEFRRSSAVDLPAQFAPDTRLRMLDIARREAPMPSPHLVTLGGWKVSTPQSAARFSAICHRFGERLRAQLGVPIGLVGASWGGTRIAAFVDAATLRARDLGRTRDLGRARPDQVSRQNDGHVFNAMIAPLAPLGLRGVLWYQGESDTHRPDRYGERLAALAASWRRTFGQSLPMIVVQLPPFAPPPPATPGNWAVIREAQRRFVARDPAAGLVVQIDQRGADDLHPPYKAAVADRAAAIALRIAYRAPAGSTGPVLKRVSRRGRRLTLYYTVDDRLTSARGRAVSGFELCAETCVKVTGHLSGPDTVALIIPANVAARCVRYAWADAPRADLVSTNGWPASPLAESLGSDSATLNRGAGPCG
ncbi:sialate O-acetylesterase [Sphingomonas suaedae]|uniref:Sialate O-acetylesterase n=1 Tax=Sphingomonas suaedae TaxID=2599297 RepID=A0A518RIZ3_9SPHN|nr:sialate O-acetylesterase [Sphingomonas suaedae]QDX27401.1 sialate O-acetylesterase [Sphingomonas suaedae]